MKKSRCQVYFVGAGPGDPELITVKGRKCIQNADLVLYTGSLVPKEIVSCAREDAEVMDSSSMTLTETHSMIVEAVSSGAMVARVHTGDPSLYGAVKEQMVLLDRENIPYEVIPGVTVAFAGAAKARISFTLPEVTQTLIFARMGGRTPVPERERLRSLAAHRCSLAIYLSAGNPAKMVEELLAGGYPEDTPVFVGYRVGWPDELAFFSTLSGLVQDVTNASITRQAVFLVLPGQEDASFSRLYDPRFSHGFRKRTG